MDRERRNRILLIGGIILLVLIIIFLIWWFWPRGSKPTVAPSENINRTTQLPGGNSVNAPVIASPVLEEQKDAVRLARLFAERFGTFTSQGQFEGVLTLVPVSTPSLQGWLIGHYIPDLRTKYPATSYVGQTTQVLGVASQTIDAKNATVVLHTQVSITQTGKAAVVTNPDMKLVLINGDTGWLVDNVTWVTLPTK